MSGRGRDLSDFMKAQIYALHHYVHWCYDHILDTIGVRYFTVICTQLQENPFLEEKMLRTDYLKGELKILITKPLLHTQEV